MYARTSVNGMKLIVGDLNARLHKSLPGEELYIGAHVYGDPAARLSLGSNRELLLELCAAEGLTVANTHFNHERVKQVTFRNNGVLLADPLSPNHFGRNQTCTWSWMSTAMFRNHWRVSTFYFWLR